MQPDEAPKSILVIAVARIGDTLLVTPAIRALKERYPSAQLTVLAHPKRREVLENLPFIDHLGSITPKRARWYGWLPGLRYDLAVIYGKDIPLAAYALRVARKVVVVGWRNLTATGRLSIVPPLSGDVSLHAVNERARVVEALGAELQDRRLAYCVSEAERAWATRWLQKKGAESQRPLIGLQICSFPTKAHRDWPVASFKALIDRLIEAERNSRFLILGDQLAREASKPLIEAFGERVLVAAGDTTLRQTAALIDQLDLYVGVDTGPTHIAGALDVPMVALYHADYPGRNLAPLDRRDCVVLEHPQTGRIASGQASMADIDVDVVAKAALSLLSDPIISTG